jgi:hypothetical protein
MYENLCYTLTKDTKLVGTVIHEAQVCGARKYSLNFYLPYMEDVLVGVVYYLHIGMEIAGDEFHAWVDGVDSTSPSDFCSPGYHLVTSMKEYGLRGVE